VWRLLRLLIQHVVVGISYKWPVVGMEEHLVRDLKQADIIVVNTQSHILLIKIMVKMNLKAYLVILAAGAEAKDEQVTVGIGGCKVLPIGTTFTVKQCSVPLALNLSTRRERETTSDASDKTAENCS